MNIEIERKFLLKNDSWLSAVTKKIAMRQGYLAEEAGITVRIRIEDDEAFMTVKGKPTTDKPLTRSEYTMPIPYDKAIKMLEAFCPPHQQVVKTRHHVTFGEKLWEIDVFHDENDGLIVAELELGSEDETFDLPDWLGDDVSHDSRYGNGRLSRNPYSKWIK